MKAILLIDHGSRRQEANDMVHCMANLVQALAGPEVIVRPAHMDTAMDFDCCWSPDKVAISCGDACRVKQTLLVGA